jgi:hypothetical protein
MTDPWRDDEFEAYLKRRLPIGRRLTSLERLEPPEELDRLIIDKARQAIHSPPEVRHFRAPKWSLPLGLAATILISLSVLFDLGMRGAMHKDAMRSRPESVLEASPGGVAESSQWPPQAAPVVTTDAAHAPADNFGTRSRIAERERAVKRLRALEAPAVADDAPHAEAAIRMASAARIAGVRATPEIETVTIIGQRVRN